MKVFQILLVLALLLATVTAAVVPSSVSASLISASYDKDVSVKNSTNEIYPNGNYKFYYELSDGSLRSEEGQVKNEGQENQYIDVTGSYGWKGPDNKLHQVNYSAGVEGFKSEIKEV